MFALPMERSRSDSSTSSTSSALSLSPYGWTPRGAALLPPMTTTATPLSGSVEYAHIPALMRRTSAPASKRGLAVPAALQYETFCPSSGRGAYAYPHWPAGDSLSANSSPAERTTPAAAHAAAAAGAASAAVSGHYYAPPSSKISDEDLEGLDFSQAPQPPTSLDTLPELPVGGPSLAAGISWSQVGAHAACAPAADERRRRLPPPPAGFMMRCDSGRRSKRSPSRKRSDRN